MFAQHRVDEIAPAINRPIQVLPRAGNQVALEGRLERYRQRIHPEWSKAVGAAVETWRAQQQGELAQLAYEAQAAGQRHRARAACALLYEDRLWLRAGNVALIAGAPLHDLKEVARNRQTWTRAAQARRTQYQERQKRLDYGGTPEGAADGHG